MKKRTIFSLLSLSIMSIATISIGVSLSAYVGHAQINQTIGVTGSRYIYLKPTDVWDLDNADEAFFMYGCNGNASAKWFASVGSFGTRPNKIWYFPALDSTDYANVIFSRASSSVTISNISFNTDWNQTIDLTVGTNSLYTITNMTGGGNNNDKSYGSWSIYSPS